MGTKANQSRLDLRSFWDAGEDGNSILTLGRQCLTPFSKDVQNRDARNKPQSWIHRVSSTDGSCGKRSCPWRDNVDSLHLKVLSHWEVNPADNPTCDAADGKTDGVILIPELITRVIRTVSPPPKRTDEDRGLHAGCFTWTFGSDGTVIEGEVQGLSNLGTVRSWTNTPEELMAEANILGLSLTMTQAQALAKRITQRCNAQGFLEGRLHGRVVKTRSPRFTGARVVGIYRFYTDPSYFAVKSKTAQLTGLVEGLFVTPCDR